MRSAVEGNKVPVSAVRNYWEPKATVWHTHENLTPYLVGLIRESISPYIQGLEKKARVLDIASGANPFDYLPEEIKPNVTALDVSKTALTFNPSRYKVIADARKDLPFQTNSFDLVICIFGMRYFENQEHVVSEMMRVLKPQGTFLIIDFVNAQNLAVVRSFDTTALLDTSRQFGSTRLQSGRIFKGNPHESPIDLIAGKKLLQREEIRVAA